MSELKRHLFDFYLGSSKLCLGRETKIMGVLNVTPDSFSDGGSFASVANATRRALQIEEEGAHILDVGGESSRPGSRPVSAREEIQRIRPVLKKLAKRIQIPISVDTYKYEVARMALDEGAVLINDIYALNYDKRLPKMLARSKAGVVLMHMQGNPETMQKKIFYHDFFKEILRYLKTSMDKALDAGVEPSRIVLDPGFGFGKTPQQNLEMLQYLDRFSKLKKPILVGLSRKSFIGALVNMPAKDRLFGSLAAAGAAIERGAHILRVHDVAAHKQFAAVLDAALLQPEVRL